MAATLRSRGRFLVFLAALVTATLVLAGALRPAHAAQPGTILPNLVADPVDGFEIEPFSWEGKTRLLLRFNGYIHNKGPGAVDFRGSRQAPTLKNPSRTFEKEAKHEAFTHEEEVELASPPMKTTQRLFTTSAEETNFNRPHVEEPSSGKLIYSSADGHNHWHLQEIARYTLMNEAKTGEVAPAQKVGFCLDDSEGQHVETKIGPSQPVYSDKTGRKFCREWEPSTTELWEGISPGWRDKYSSELALQWVDVSNVQPGHYYLRDEVNQLGFVIEEPGANPASFTAVTIPGYVALEESDATPYQTPVTIKLAATSFSPKSGVEYKIVGAPSHGAISPPNSEGKVTYTPSAGFSGTDSFTFTAREKSSSYPEHPQPARVSIAVGENPAVPNIQITSAPSALVAGTSGTLKAAAKNDTGAIDWSATGGATVKSEGLSGETATLTAPTQTGKVTVTAQLADNPGVTASTEVEVLPAPAPESAPIVPTSTVNGNGGVAGQTVSQPVGLTKPRAMIVGRYLEMSTKAGLAGRIRLSVYDGKALLGSCLNLTPAGRTFTCRLKLRPGRLHDRLRIVASLRFGDKLLATTLGPERIPKMVMVKSSKLDVGAHAASDASVFWCNPEAVVAALGG